MILIFLKNKKYSFLVVLVGLLLYFVGTPSSISAKEVICTSGKVPNHYTKKYRDVELVQIGIIIKLDSWERAVLLNNGSIEVMSDSTFNYYQCMVNAKKHGLQVVGGISPITDNYRLVMGSQKDTIKQIVSDYSVHSNSSTPSFETIEWYGKSAIVIYVKDDRFTRTLGIVIPLNEKLLVIKPSYQRPLDGESGVYKLLSKIRPLNLLQ